MAYAYEHSLRHFVDTKIKQKNVRTTAIGAENKGTEVPPSMFGGFGYGAPPLSDEERDAQIKQAIIDLLGVGKKTAQPEIHVSL